MSSTLSRTVQMERRAITVSIAGGKGGCWKTATAAHFAQWLGLKGFRVLVADIDPQAHLSMYFGYHPEAKHDG
ncbi:ParA family protein (plasmid) [Vibrio metschnikovii]|uniref:ParA family protein n=1 Tax=Vibrio metschnikovii TaxID=28172 RepID=UPI00315C9162